MRYPDGTILIYKGELRKHFEKGKKYTAFRSRLGDGYLLPEATGLPDGWNASFVEDKTQFTPFSPTWKERITGEKQ